MWINVGEYHEHIHANLVILLYLGSRFTWDKVFKVLRPLPNHVKNQRLLVHILWPLTLITPSHEYNHVHLQVNSKLLFTSQDTIAFMITSISHHNDFFSPF